MSAWTAVLPLVGWGDIPAWLSLVVSLFVLWRSQRTQKQVDVLRSRAEIRPELRHDATHDFWRLYLVNKGRIEANNIQVSLDGKPIGECRGAVGGLPSLIGAGGEVSCIMVFHMDFAPPLEIEVRWEDQYGKDGRYRTTLTF